MGAYRVTFSYEREVVQGKLIFVVRATSVIQHTHSEHAAPLAVHEARIACHTHPAAPIEVQDAHAKILLQLTAPSDDSDVNVAHVAMHVGLVV